jgi:cytochrome c peroxidase
VSTLNTAIMQMSEYQLGKPLTPADVKSIAVFLATLTGPLPSEYIKRPNCPLAARPRPRPEAD